MNERRTRTLTFHSDPVARMRELHDLDIPPAGAVSCPAALETQQRSDEAASESSNMGAQLSGNEDVSDTLEQPSSAATPQHRSRRAQKRSRAAPAVERSSAGEENPLHQAMREMLLRPYPADLAQGASTATTIRVPTELWKRLDVASSLLHQTGASFHHKQDIITEALKRFLVKVARSEL